MIGGSSGNLFVDIGLVIIIAATLAYFLRLLKQPQLLAYVLTGILLGPVFKLVTQTTLIETMSVVGIAFLLFIVGLEMDLKSLKNVATISTFGGVIQVIIVFTLSYLIALLLGFLSLEASYIGLMIAFSSTMVVMKLLSDKRELNTLHGKIAVGILLTQDIIAIFALSILTSINGFSPSVFGFALFKFASLFLVAYLASKYLFPMVFRFAARYQELLLITSLGVCFIFSLAFHFLGFSIAIGAFVAGIALGNLEYNFEIIGKVKSLKDFFSLIFFVSLGMAISLTVIKNMIFELIVLLVVILVLKPIIIMTVCSFFRYTKKPSFLTANSLAQVGEFSLILAAQGLLLGHISNELFSLIIMFTLISIVVTSYYIKYDNFFYKIMEKPLSFFDRFTTEGLEFLPNQVKPTIILCGHNRIGYSVLKDLSRVKKKVLIIDYNPEIIDKMVKKGYHCIYGEVTDDEIIHKMNLRNIKMLISTVPDLKDNLLLTKKVREKNKKAKIIVHANEINDALKLYDHGADYVIMPHFLGGERVSDIVGQIRSRKINMKDEKKRHIAELSERKELGHEHPKHD